MTIWIIEPRDPLIVRDGKPFDLAPGGRAESLAFPFPSTIAGGVRTRYAIGQDADFDNEQGKAELIETLKRLQVRGPLLVELSTESGEIEEWFAPAPADALIMDAQSAQQERVVIRRLEPQSPPEGAITNIPDGMMPVYPASKDRNKPSVRAPKFWRWPKFEQWLLDPIDGIEIGLTELGHNGPIREIRTHVSVRPDSGTAADGALFQTGGLEFVRCDPGISDRRTGFNAAKRLGLAVATDAPGLGAGLGLFGGERRIIDWRASARPMPACPEKLCEAIAAARACRVILLTPGHFEAGSSPSWLLAERDGVAPSLKAAVTARAQVVSGWDLATRKPKPTRRLVPAGGVFFLGLDGEPDAIKRWVKSIWMECISDDAQDRRDGFGLTALGVWSGCDKRVEVEA
ncbi:MAG: type III-B CRISPR module-associated protein Cmr3 [Blastocatellales bacterium]|nr:type III-B CRISPR module-associated protein Cmr3 [Blastocatellales bacterium]